MNIIIHLVYLILPLLLAYLHFRVKKQHDGANCWELTHQYFMFFNVVLKGFPIAIGMIFFGKESAEFNGWAYSPLFIEYGIAVFSLACLGIFALFIKGSFRSAASLGFAIFLLLAAISHLLQLGQGDGGHLPNINALITFDFISAALLIFLSLKRLCPKNCCPKKAEPKKAEQ